MCAYQVKKCSFFGKFDGLCFLFTSVLNSSFCLITSQKMKFSIKDFFSKCDQIRSFCVVYGGKITPCTTLIHCTFYFFLISLIRTFSFSHRLKVLRSQSNKSWRKKLQKQSFSDILQNRCSYKFRNFSGKYLCWSFFLIKLQV